MYQILNSNNAYRNISNIFCLQRQDRVHRRISDTPVDAEIIRLARNLAFPTFPMDSPIPPQDKVGI